MLHFTFSRREGWGRRACRHRTGPLRAAQGAVCRGSLAAACLFLGTTVRVRAEGWRETDEGEVQRVHQSILKLGAHVLSTDRSVVGGPNRANDPADLAEASTDALVIALTPPTRVAGPEPARKPGTLLLLDQLDQVRSWVGQHRRDLGLATRAREVRTYKVSGRQAVLVGLEGLPSDDGLLASLRQYSRMGVRLFAFTRPGDAGERAMLDTGDGLSEAGLRCIPELNRLGYVIDASDLSALALMQVLTRSRAPVVARQPVARDRCGQARLLSDAEALAISEGGGVIQVIASFPTPKTPSIPTVCTGGSLPMADPAPHLGTLAGEPSDPTVASLEPGERSRVPRAPASGAEEWLAVIDHLVELVGVDHVGIALEAAPTRAEVPPAERGGSIAVTRELLRRGYSERAIAKLWGENVVRVIETAETVADAWTGSVSLD
ncbi:MAG: membrane dipeptidase [Opitutaceae bacterium]|nr:membrane dipeptidase [Opitutaceae bacterium]